MAEIATAVFVRWQLIWSWLESLRVFFSSSCPLILLGHRSLPFEEGTNKIAISLNCGNEFESNLGMSPPGESWYWFATNHHRDLKQKGQFIYKWENSQRNHFFSPQTADLLTVMQPSTRATFSGLCFRLLPKCLLAPTVCILKSVFHSASCSFLAQDSVKWTSAINFGLSNRMCVCVCVYPCEPLGCWLTFNVPSPRVRGREIDDVFTLTHLVSSVSSRMTHGDSSTPTHFSKLWATCCVSGMACTHRWAWQTCGWPSSAWS